MNSTWLFNALNSLSAGAQAAKEPSPATERMIGAMYGLFVREATKDAYDCTPVRYTPTTLETHTEVMWKREDVA
jgi:hypothetical protein